MYVDFPVLEYSRLIFLKKKKILDLKNIFKCSHKLSRKENVYKNSEKQTEPSSLFKLCRHLMNLLNFTSLWISQTQQSPEGGQRSGSTWCSCTWRRRCWSVAPARLLKTKGDLAGPLALAVQFLGFWRRCKQIYSVGFLFDYEKKIKNTNQVLCFSLILL